ncbi:RsbR protein [Sporosarcina sp. P21c]|uniref:RsbT co-antagonist protein RsbRA n=1 Tax=Sporosarcina TaxID=1569 RepID=UPI000A162C6B|nr:MULTISPECIES: RsbT co-antagonist protein RsbRA [Sporosarcina]ARJ38678.1 RsbR protein [Sporosarcina ureae]PIC65794.1 RsbR protein [Sporosarcina sp. P16a]PIC81842.1 RsbR protein [Sporosarcina sp. P1]PIC87475.1 RsbR protein [Sporosarcina sp. P21c]PIC91399.1 RsbR protein [Sporosarcina sp. P25]
MNEVMKKGIAENIDIITTRWVEQMKENADERFLDLMPEAVVATTSREFAELMTSNLSYRETVDKGRLDEFTEKIIHFGWSIKFINRAIDTFSGVVYNLFFETGILRESNLREGINILSNWINPLRESIIEEYSTKWERTDILQKIALQELSASLIPVFDKISVMPLVGTIDTERAKLIMENLLEGVVKQRAEVVLLDITGVPVVDTMVAHHIIQAADAVRLVGAKCMLVGIRPEIAQTIVTLGINLTDFSTTSTLRRGMQKALEMTGRTIVEEEK